jgi:hypothetical protein
MQTTEKEIVETVEINGVPVHVKMIPTRRPDGIYYFEDIPGVDAVDVIRALQDQAVDTWLLLYPKHQRDKALYFSLISQQAIDALKKPLKYL